ncbi:EVE domain-containing protein [Aquirufa nivalisilvae]|jgi:predicted RNA-binding protein with PUA-like domain|uniref:Thymocyte nuclear protein n=1 Tax=Aquirufa nivalisilvae TaxID=2516557 RepID=A0A2S2DVG9_9BACT|nr:EVE domain-containing protein [Aquirufa nivalisilvae]AWL09346.1 Thymocyte nuclear protein [Aquirufa nivalisilvae]MCZ2480158.1 EVE domain-containing protein [Aquirufa nivalisilvae]MCZ2482447.1 EVE domain-containing protein [Aquirufa nivalisilvae]TBH73830.1 EVE domain-containing protein [Aquirufa nivalisilvae]
MNHWLVKSEPFKYSWDDFVKEGKSVWDGVRNYQARNNLMAMKKGDWVYFYHSNEGLEVVGLAEVSKEHYPDPTTDDPRWVVVELIPIRKFNKTVTLKQMKSDDRLGNLALLKQSRLSVTPVDKPEFDIIMSLTE